MRKSLNLFLRLCCIITDYKIIPLKTNIKIYFSDIKGYGLKIFIEDQFNVQYYKSGFYILEDWWCSK